METIRVVAGVLIDERGRVFCARRSMKGELPGKWEFPGGKVENDETPREALRRELKEELGITANIGERLMVVEHDYETFHLLMSVYTFDIDAGRIDLKVHEACAWMTVEELGTLDWASANRPILMKLLDRKGNNG